MVTSWTDITFYCCAAVAIITGWRVFKTDSMVRASFLLLASFLAVGIIMLLLGAVYLGSALFFMMAVEMMVMALFMVMFMMNPAGLNPMNMVHQEHVARALGLGIFLALSAVAVWGEFPSQPAPQNLAPVQSLGKELLGDSMLVFESAGIALLATMIGTVVLSSHRGRYGSANENSQPPGLNPQGPPAKTPAQKAREREAQKEQEEKQKENKKEQEHDKERGNNGDDKGHENDANHRQ